MESVSVPRCRVQRRFTEVKLSESASVLGIYRILAAHEEAHGESTGAQVNESGAEKATCYKSNSTDFRPSECFSDINAKRSKSKVASVSR